MELKPVDWRPGLEVRQNGVGPTDRRPSLEVRPDGGARNFDNAPKERKRSMAVPAPAKKKRRTFVLCFDGTGNKFSGTDSDSNILKIFRCLFRDDPDQYHYYQPGIGTYVSSNDFTSKGRVARMKSAYLKAKDSAIGTSFDQHVMGGYKFLMRYYNPGDDIYFFGFSRGAYTARFLAEMLDHVGLLSMGNEEMARFAWKTFQKWQTRTEKTEEEKAEKKELLDFMLAFRETFSRPVRRIRFLGLFDTVNSVPHFENAWMQRTKFPYTARSTAKVIRHAVAIDERRAKFRQDLISQVRQKPKPRYRHRHFSLYPKSRENVAEEEEEDRGRTTEKAPEKSKSSSHAYRNASETKGIRALSPNFSIGRSIDTVSMSSLRALDKDFDEMSDGENDQDIQEVWFPGCHADIGGGWDNPKDGPPPLSQVPLVWMIREAMNAGLQFDEKKLHALNCCPEEGYNGGAAPNEGAGPKIEIDSPSPHEGSPKEQYFDASSARDHGANAPEMSHFHRHVHHAATLGMIHDVLQFRNGATASSVVSWNIMEYLPFRRMDLQEDGSWKSITWPLPKGEVRDIPVDAVIHNSVLRRMKANENYRPGNLICGGGGRGVRKAPEEMGMGKWKITREPGDMVGEVYVRDDAPRRMG